MFKTTKKGNLTVETAIVLPLVIIGILTIGYLIKVNSINENVLNRAVEESRALCIDSYTDVGKLSALKFTNELRALILEENSNIAEAEVNHFKYLHTAKGIDKLISFDVDYVMYLNFPISFYKQIDGKETILCRAFLGKDLYNQEIGFALMEESALSELVWIFPVAGEKYHKENCSYIKVAASRTMLNTALRRKYNACNICKPDKLNNGSQIYCFFGSGRVYHQGNCYIVDRYVVEVQKTEAEKRGYTPCLKCGGV